MENEARIRTPNFETLQRSSTTVGSTFALRCGDFTAHGLQQRHASAPVAWIKEGRAAQARHAGNRDDAAAAMAALPDFSAQEQRGKLAHRCQVCRRRHVVTNPILKQWHEQQEGLAVMPGGVFETQEAAAEVDSAGVVKLLCRNVAQRRPVRSVDDTGGKHRSVQHTKTLGCCIEGPDDAVL